MTYQYECPVCGEVELQFSMNEYPGSNVWQPCPNCVHLYAARVFTAPYFQEDRRHHGGRRWSNSLGGYAPQSRAEMKVLEKQKGIVFESPTDPICAEGVAARDYQRAIDDGATHEQAEAVAPWPKPPEREFPYQQWKKKRYDAGKPMDRLTESEMSQGLADAGWKPD